MTKKSNKKQTKSTPTSKKTANGQKQKASLSKVATATKKALERKERPLSGLDAAARVLKEAGQPLTCKAMMETVLAKGYWKTGGKTPWATLYSAIIREIDDKKGESRFKKTGRGLFEHTGKVTERS